MLFLGLIHTSTYTDFPQLFSAWTFKCIHIVQLLCPANSCLLSHFSLFIVFLLRQMIRSISFLHCGQFTDTLTFWSACICSFEGADGRAHQAHAWGSTEVYPTHSPISNYSSIMAPLESEWVWGETKEWVVVFHYSIKCGKSAKLSALYQRLWAEHKSDWP